MSQKEKWNDKEILFVHHYVIHKNQTKAAKEAGYSKRTAASQGNRLLKKAKIRAEVDRRLGRIARKLEITAERVLDELARVAMYDPGDLYDEDGNLLPIQDLPEDTRRAIRGWDITVSENEFINGGGDIYRIERVKSIKPRLADKRPALRDLGQHLKLFGSEEPADQRPIVLNVQIGDKPGKPKPPQPGV